MTMARAGLVWDSQSSGLSISPQAGGLPQRDPAQPLGCGGAELGSKKVRMDRVGLAIAARAVCLSSRKS